MKFRIYVSVSRARGSQVWELEAEDPAQARALWEDGEGELVQEELEADDQEIDKIEAVNG